VSVPARSDAVESFRRLQELYPVALPEVYGYLRRRCGDPCLAEDLAADTFLQAARSLRDGQVTLVTTPWLMTVARHKLVDHWRRDTRATQVLESSGGADYVDGWDEHLDAMIAQETLRTLPPQQRIVLTLRYVDDLPVALVAEHIDRTLHATEALLVRARAAFRRAYDAIGGGPR